MGASEDSNPFILMGFTALESQVYMLLLSEFPATGYKIAKNLGKPTANTYKALESLERKGAVVVEEGERRMFRPIPPESLLSQMDERYRQLRGQADRTLSELYEETRDDRVYRVRSIEQVLMKARSMLDGAEEIVLIDAFPETIDLLESSMRGAIERGVLTAVKSYAPLTIEGAVAVIGAGAKKTRQRWPGRWLNMVADGAQYMMVLLGKDGREVIQAVWTECPYLSWVHHSAFSAEIILAALESRIDAGASSAELKALKRELSRLKAPSAPGYRSIMQHFDDAQ